MPETIWDFAALTTPALEDLLAVVDDPSGTPLSKKLSLSDFNKLCLRDVAIQVKTEGSGTYTPTSGMRYVLVIAVAGGGGSGNALDTDCAAGGGAGGSTVIRLLTASQIGASKAYVVGGGGTATNTGGATTLDGGTLINAPGGDNGSTGVASGGVIGTSTLGGVPTAVSGGDLNIPGGEGGRGIIWSGNHGWGGKGGNTPFGFGPYCGGTDTPGVAGQNYGSGASGGHAAGATDRAGATGAPGILIFLEFI